MPNTKSAERRMRGNERKHQHNRSIKSNLRNVEKDYRALLTAGKKTRPRKPCPASIPSRQGRQVRRAHPPHRQPEEVPARGGVN